MGCWIYELANTSALYKIASDLWMLVVEDQNECHVDIEETRGASRAFKPVQESGNRLHIGNSDQLLLVGICILPHNPAHLLDILRIRAIHHERHELDV